MRVLSSGTANIANATAQTAVVDYTVSTAPTTTEAHLFVGGATADSVLTLVVEVTPSGGSAYLRTLDTQTITATDNLLLLPAIALRIGDRLRVLVTSDTADALTVPYVIYDRAALIPISRGNQALIDGSGYVTVGTNNDKTGYSISGTKTTLDALNDIAATAIVSGGAITTSGGAVSNVTTVATTTSNSDMRGTDNAFLAASAPGNFSLLAINGSGHISRVGLVDTTTTNSDMRGTDSALLAASAPTNWSLLAINGSGEVTTSNPASGGGSAHTAEGPMRCLCLQHSSPDKLEFVGDQWFVAKSQHLIQPVAADLIIRLRMSRR